MSYKAKDYLNWLNAIYLNKDKTCYLLGGIGTELTTSLLNSKCNQYSYNAGRKTMLQKIADKGYIGLDCVCLYKVFFFLKGYTVDKVVYDSTYDLNETGIYSKATTKGTIDSMPDVAGIGLVMPGHFGVYLGNNTVIEVTPSTTFAKQSHGCGGVCKTKLTDRSWTKWCYLPGIDYTVSVKAGDTVKFKKYCMRPFDNYSFTDNSGKVIRGGVVNNEGTGRVIAVQNYSNFNNITAYPIIVDTGNSIVFVSKSDLE